MSALRCFALTAAVVVSCVVGCEKSDSTTPSAEPASTAGEKAASGGERESFTIGMSQCNLGEPWRVQMNADIRKAAEAHPELKVIYKDAQNDTLRQRSHIEEYVSSDVDLIIVSPKEAAPLTPPIAKAVKAGIPVIVLDRRVLETSTPASSGPTTRRSAGRPASGWSSSLAGRVRSWSSRA